MQAIVTKYLPPTRTKPGRVKAVCEAASVTLSWDPELAQENHDRAALELAKKLGWDQHWYGTMVCGWLPSVSKFNCVFVFTGGDQ